jgi:hypothetical protein
MRAHAVVSEHLVNVGAMRYAQCAGGKMTDRTTMMQMMFEAAQMVDLVLQKPVKHSESSVRRYELGDNKISI